MKKFNVTSYEPKRCEIFSIPFTYPSMNKILAMHPLTRQRAHDRFQYQAGLIINARHVAAFVGMVQISMDLCFKTKRRRDIDNFSPKWLLDVLVKCALIRDDSTAVIPEAVDIQIYGGEPESRVDVRITAI